MTWTRAVRRTTMGQSGFVLERPYLSGENGAELDFSCSARDGFYVSHFTLRRGGRDFKFSAERDHDIPPLSQTVSDTRPEALPLVLGPDCLVRVMPKRETRRSWTEDVVAEASEGIKSALRALHELAPDFCSSPIQRIRFDHANEFVLLSDYPENIRPGETPVWFMRCAEEYAWFPKVTWASDPPAETWPANVNAPGRTLPRFTMIGEVTMPDLFFVQGFRPPFGLPIHFGRIVSLRARNVIESVAPDELAYRPLSIEMPAHMLPAASYFLIEPTRKAQMIDWDRSPKVLSGGDPTEITVGLHPTKITVSWYHHIGHLIFRSRKPGDPHIWREVAPVSEKFDYRVPGRICMSESMWTALWEKFPGQLDQRSRSA